MQWSLCTWLKCGYYFRYWTNSATLAMCGGFFFVFLVVHLKDVKKNNMLHQVLKSRLFFLNSTKFHSSHHLFSFVVILMENFHSDVSIFVSQKCICSEFARVVFLFISHRTHWNSTAIFVEIVFRADLTLWCIYIQTLLSGIGSNFVIEKIF